MELLKLNLSKITYFLKNNIPWIGFPDINIYSVLELILLTVIIYEIFKWVRDKKAYTLFKGIMFFIIFYALCYFFNFYTFLWFFNKTITVLIIALLVIFQPELRKALESIGERKITKFSFFNKVTYSERFSDKTIEEILNAVKIMSNAKTGALILIEQDNSLIEYEKTGIQINADISSQLLVNIFEHNTPLHDGALTIKSNKIIAATCYLPLSENMDVNKSLGTRHRAALGVSEAVDCLVIVVSEETGNISLAKSGILLINVKEKTLRDELEIVQDKKTENKESIFKLKIKEAILWVKTLSIK